MAAPPRGNTGYNCYFITASTFQKQSLFQSERMAQLFVEVLLHYRQQGKYLLHEFVLMPNTFICSSLRRSLLRERFSLIKAVFPFRARKGLGVSYEIWQPSFYDRRVRNIDEYRAFREYIHFNPIKRGLAKTPDEYACSSAWPGFALDDLPQRLKLRRLRGV